MTVPYIFGTATTSIPLSNLDSNFNTPITLGNTSIYLGNTTTTIGNLTLTNATISSGNIANITITNVSVTTANVTNITVTGTANIATGNVTTLTSTSITDSGLTSGRVTFAGASGLLSDSANLTYSGSALTVASGIFKANGAPSLSAATAGEAILAPEGTYGALLYGRGTTYDVVLAQRSTGVALGVLAGTNNVTFPGLVGIGTSSPTQKLDVNGNVIIPLNNSYYLYTTDYGVGTGSGLEIFTGTADSIRFIRNGKAGTETMRITGTGNVGIGTSSPNQKLTLGSSDGTQALSFVTSTYLGDGALIGNIEFSTNNADSDYGNLANIKAYKTGTNTNSGDLTFWTKGSAVSSERVRITNAGNVGIGRTPDQRLQIASDTAVEFDMFVSTTRTLTLYADATQTIIGNPTFVPMKFRTNDLERMQINASGNLLLGTTTQRNASKFTLEFNGSTNNGIAIMETATASGVEFVTFLNPAGTNIANITRVGVSDAVTFNTTSSNTTGAQLNASGVRFPATQVASADANTLDDYEEGTWTPSLGGNTTYNAQNGKYIKIGKMVYVEGQINVNSIGTGSTSLVSGLPFTSATQVGSRGGLFVNYFTNTANLVTYITLYLNSAATTAQFQGIAAAGTSMSTIGIFGNSTDVYFSGCYETSN